MEEAIVPEAVIHAHEDTYICMFAKKDMKLPLLPQAVDFFLVLFLCGLNKTNYTVLLVSFINVVRGISFVLDRARLATSPCFQSYILPNMLNHFF